MGQPRIVDGKSMLVAGYEQTFPFTDISGIPSLWDRFAPNIGRVPGQVGGVCYGVCHGGTNTGFRYLACVEVSNAEGLSSDLTTLQVPAQQYAVFTHDGHVSQLKDAMDSIWKQWLPQSGYQMGDSGMVIERYGEKFDPEAGKGDLEIWLAVK